MVREGDGHILLAQLILGICDCISEGAWWASFCCVHIWVHCSVVQQHCICDEAGIYIAELHRHITYGRGELQDMISVKCSVR